MIALKGFRRNAIPVLCSLREDVRWCLFANWQSINEGLSFDALSLDLFFSTQTVIGSLFIFYLLLYLPSENTFDSDKGNVSFVSRYSDLKQGEQFFYYISSSPPSCAYKIDLVLVLPSNVYNISHSTIFRNNYLPFSMTCVTDRIFHSLRKSTAAKSKRHRLIFSTILQLAQLLHIAFTPTI